MFIKRFINVGVLSTYQGVENSRSYKHHRYHVLVVDVPEAKPISRHFCLLKNPTDSLNYEMCE